MRNIIINEAESIFEVLWDLGEPGTRKYCCLDEWTVEEGVHGKRTVDAYEAVQFEIYPNYDNRTYPFWMARNCNLDISEYDTLILRAIIAKGINFRMLCRIDGVDKEVIRDIGDDAIREYNGHIDGKEITHIRIEFECVSQAAGIAGISWLGLAHSGRLEKMLARKSPYTPDWPGCFAQTPDMTPQLGLYFAKEDLAEVRRKANSASMKPTMELMREMARADMEIVPEATIGDGLGILRNVSRVRDVKNPRLYEPMERLAFVGLIDQNEEMLRMACRMALSACHSRSFADGYMTGFPGVTWHCRSFAEKYICIAISKVLDWAGGMLTWHGKNVIQDALIMKGIPRMDSDLKTMDDIRYTNQGLTFCGGLLTTLAAVCQRYPRYRMRVEEAEQDLLAMLSGYVQVDGGVTEGPGYWNFTFKTVTETLLLLARYHGKELSEYVPDYIRKTALYGEAVWSEVEETPDYIPYNVVFHDATYVPHVAMFMAKASGSPFWKQMCSRMNREGIEVSGAASAITIILNEDYEENAADMYPKDFISLDVTGVTALRRKDPQLGRTALYTISGRSYPGHFNLDKGSFMLEAGGKRLLIDRGNITYGQEQGIDLTGSDCHNMVTAVKDGVHLNQRFELFDITKETHGDLYSGYVLKSTYEEGTFSYKTDITDCWKDIFDKNVRSIESSDPTHYVIHDSLTIRSEYEVCFLLHSYGEITRDGDDYLITDGQMRLRIHTKDWIADRAEFGPYKVDGKFTPVNRLALYKGGQDHYELTTEIELTRI